MPLEKLLRRIIVFGFILLPLMPVLAQSQSGALRAALTNINRLYEELEYERALAQITSARTLARTTDEDVALSLYQGVILADMNRWEESAAALKTALFLRPEAQLPVKVSPKVSQHFEKVRQQVKQELGVGTQPAPVATAPKPAPLEPKLEPKASPEPLPEPAVPTATASTSSEPTGSSFTHPQFLIPAIASGVLLVAGGTSWALSRRELSSLNNNDPRLATREDARQAASRGSTYQSVGVGLLGAGVVGLGFAASSYLWAPTSNELSLQVGTNGTSAFVQGRWP
ncbi:MAG: hypothetical protein JXB05_30500 [Myxococcaceae bacterium]|nr:hypothetical protein [Myxococcaceae bacterium]